jgi:quinohemoprotein ethanol dehydrogenase
MQRVTRRTTAAMVALGLASAAIVAVGAQRPSPAVDDAALAAANARPGEWLAHGRTQDEQRFSPLTAITDQNVSQLKVAWTFDTGTDRVLEATPIVVDGVMYTTASWGIVFAIDARTGRELWKWDPKVDPRHERFACCDVVNRGVAFYKGRVYAAAFDGRLTALDARTGAVVWSVSTVDPAKAYTITAAPRIVKGKVIIGNGGAEYGIRGYISAYDAESGTLAWRFYTVPGDPAKPQEHPELDKAVPTWNGDKWWEYGGGGTAWDSVAFDAELNLLYVGTGNGGPWNREIRSPGGGDNLYLSSILALNPDTGRLVWHYQTTPGDSWDYTATQHMVLADLRIGGRVRQVLMQAPKNGFFYVLDRKTGELLSAEKYVEVTWASRVDLATGRPIEREGADYRRAPFLARPAPLGGHNWQPMAFSPLTGLVYLPAQDNQREFSQPQTFEFRPNQINLGGGAGGIDHAGDSRSAVYGGRLLAWDPVAQQVRWKVEYPAYWNGGTLATAGNLVFQGTAAGDVMAYRASDGARLWSAWVGTGVLAPPMTWELDGQQYVSVMAGWGGAFVPRYRSGGRLYTFSLTGTEPAPQRPPATEVAPVAFVPDTAAIARGRALFDVQCARCHNPGTTAPDLRRSAAGTYEALPTILLKGTLAGRGMPGFRVTELEVASLRQFLLDERRKLTGPPR